MELSNVGESPLSEPVQLDRGVVNICLICREPDLETGAVTKQYCCDRRKQGLRSTFLNSLNNEVFLEKQLQMA